LGSQRIQLISLKASFKNLKDTPGEWKKGGDLGAVPKIIFTDKDG
jgi:hypothetical protein